MTRRYASEISIIIGPDRDIPAPDVYTDAQTMAWIMDTYSMTVGYSSLGVVTGKPIPWAAARAGTRPPRAARSSASARPAPSCKKPVKGTTVAVQGFGNAGANLARLLHDDGARIVAVSGQQGRSLQQPRPGSPPGAGAQDAHRLRGRASGAPSASPTRSCWRPSATCWCRRPWRARSPSATPRRVRARIVAEAANGPTTPGADRVLRDHGVFVIPDILCNAGGVTVSYFEWAQDLQGFFWEEAEVEPPAREVHAARLPRGATRPAGRQKMDMRTAAYLLAVGRVAEATRVRGLFP